MHNKDSFLFTSESVTEGHPDKVCDQIVDAILDELISKESTLEKRGFVDEHGPARLKSLRCACEALVTRGYVMLAGEIRTQSFVDVEKIARQVIKDIGYSHNSGGFNYKSCGISNQIHGQSPDIAMGVDCAEAVRNIKDADEYNMVGAGDQGIMFGYACDDTQCYMPMPIFLAHRLSERLNNVRKAGELEYLRPDGKTQVTMRYVDGKPVSVCGVVVSSQHTEDVSLQTLRADIKKHVIDWVFDKYGIKLEKDADYYINPTGRFVVGGPAADTGVTGRKLIVDTYGGMGRHGGGAFSGKDPTKVDRSASYTARWVSKNIVAAGLANRCEVQFSYAIGIAKPISVHVDTFGTGQVSDEKICQIVNEVFDLRPAAIQDRLQLWRPIYRKTSNYGHFGRELPEFTWEKVDMIDQIQALV